MTAPDGRLEHLRAAAEDSGAAGGRFVARSGAQQPGVYRVTAEARRGAESAGAATVSVLVGGADLEMTDPRLNLNVLQRVAYASGGRVVGEDEIGMLAEVLRAGVPAAMLSVRKDLWHNAWSFAAIIALLAAEWVLRRRWGMR